MIDNEIKDDTVMSDVSYFSRYFSPCPCETTSQIKQSVQNDVISHTESEAVLSFSRLSPINRC